jgi:hypothetical protein
MIHDSPQSQGTGGTGSSRARIAVVVASIAFLFLGLWGGWLIYSGAIRLSLERRLDQRGVKTSGWVTHGEPSGDNRTFYLYFRFRTGEGTVHGVSQVAARENRGRPVDLTYDPADPHVCRAAQSIGRARASANVVTGSLIIGVGSFILISSLAVLRRQRPASPST